MNLHTGYTLHPAHPNAKNKPGDELTLVEGDVWKFGQNQFTSFWRSKPKDGTVVCSRDYPEASPCPYIVVGRPYKTIQLAIEAARKSAKAEYEKAKEIVRRYEAEA